MLPCNVFIKSYVVVVVVVDIKNTVYDGMGELMLIKAKPLSLFGLKVNPHTEYGDVHARNLKGCPESFETVLVC